MHVLIASGFGCSLSWARRLMDEGHDVLVWIDPGKPKDPDTNELVGDGLIQKIGGWPGALQWAKDANAAGKPTLVLFDASGMGDKADEARAAGLYTVGGGSFMDKLENDRSFGQGIAEAAGCMLPPFQEFGNLDACIEWAKDLGDIPTYWKTDKYLDSDATHGQENGEDLITYLNYIKRTYGSRIPCLVQQKIKGIALSTARWWNGRSWCSPYQSTIEHKAFMNDDVGPATGCSFNAVHFYAQDQPKVAQALGWEKLTASFLKENAPPGLYDINAIIDPAGKAHFLEWTPRLGYDSEMTSFRLFGDLGAALWGIATGQGGSSISFDIAYSTRLGVPPYPWEHTTRADKHNCVGVPVKGADGLWNKHFIPYQVKLGEDGLEMGSPEGIVGLSLAVGEKVSALHDEVIDFAMSMKKVTPGLSFRTDGGKCVKEDAEKIKEAGFEIHPGLIE